MRFAHWLLVLNVTVHSYAQTFDAIETKPEVSQWENISILRSVALQDSLSKAKLDSLNRRKASIPTQQIYSQQQWRQWYDSLTQTIGDESQKWSTLPRAVSRAAMLDALREEFFATAPDSVLTPPSKSVIQSNGVKPSTEELSRLKLLPDSLPTLPTLPGGFVSSRYLPQIDSLRRMNMRKAHLQPTIQRRFAKSSLQEYQQKRPWRERTYFEGVIGVFAGKFSRFQFSPAFGYHFTDHFSIALGPSLLVENKQPTVLTSWGIRSFLKAEFWERRVYLQGEDHLQVSGPVVREESTLFKRHSWLVSGGYLLPLSSSLALNLSVGYQLRSIQPVTSPYAPWIFRIGISSIKLPH